MSAARDHLIIFGGAFDPPHVGHVEVLKNLRASSQGARLVALPSFGNPLKSAQTSFEHRHQMAAIAFEREAEVLATEAELKSEYTWQVLEYFGAKNKKVTFVTGTDQFEQWERWNRFPAVIQMANWKVILRKPKTIESVSAAISRFVKTGLIESTSNSKEFKIRGSEYALSFFETEAKEISSTWIREQFALKKQSEVESLLPSEVFSYIERNHLYGI